MGGQLLLNSGGILLHAWRRTVLVHIADGRADTGEGPRAVPERADEAGRKRIGQRHGRRPRRLRRDRVLREPELAEVAAGAARHRVVPRRPIKPVAGAQRRRGLERVDDAHAGRPLEGGLVALRGLVAVHAGKHQPAADLARRRPGDRIGRDRHGAERARRRGVEPDREVVVDLAHAVFVLEAEAVVQRQPRADPPVVLHVAAVVVRVDIEGRRQGHGALARGVGRRVAEEEAGERVAVGRTAVVQPGRRGELLVEREASGRVTGIEQIDAELAVVGAELEGMAADELRVARVEVPGLVGAERRRNRPEAAVSGHRTIRELGSTGLLNLVEEGLREAESGGIEIDRHRVVVDKPRPAVAQREHRVIAQHPGVVQREDLGPPLQQVVVGIGEAGGAVEPDLEIVGVGFVGAVVEVEAGERHAVVELVLTLEGVFLLEVVDDLGRPGVVVRAVVDVDIRQRQVAGDGCGHRD